MTTSLQLNDVTFGYEPTRPIVGPMTLALDAGTFLAVIGPNGAGKSTLISLLAGLLRPQSGTVHVDGRDIQSYSKRLLAQKIAVVKQEFIPVFGFSVIETVMMARAPYLSPFGFERQNDRDIVNEALELTDTAQFASRPLAELSGGERQRVFIARALAQDTPILLLDEPTSFLDLNHQVRIYDLLKHIQQEKRRTIVSVTHDINQAAQYCDQALLLRRSAITPNSIISHSGDTNDERYCVGPTSKVLTSVEIERAFQVRVFSAPVGAERVFLPLGKMAKDASRMNLP